MKNKRVFSQAMINKAKNMTKKKMEKLSSGKRASINAVRSSIGLPHIKIKAKEPAPKPLFVQKVLSETKRVTVPKGTNVTIELVFK